MSKSYISSIEPKASLISQNSLKNIRQTAKNTSYGIESEDDFIRLYN